MCCGLEPSQLELLGSKAGAAWAGRALAERPCHFPRLAGPKALRHSLTPSLKRPASLRGQKPSSGLPGPSPLSPPGAPSSQLQRLPSSRWPTAGLAERLPDVAGGAAVWVRWAAVNASEKCWGLAPGKECVWLVWGYHAQITLHLLSPSLPTSVGRRIHNRKIKSIRHCRRCQCTPSWPPIAPLSRVSAGSTRSY